MHFIVKLSNLGTRFDAYQKTFHLRKRFINLLKLWGRSRTFLTFTSKRGFLFSIFEFQFLQFFLIESRICFWNVEQWSFLYILWMKLYFKMFQRWSLSQWYRSLFDIYRTFNRLFLPSVGLDDGAFCLRIRHRDRIS